jgi:hypothetical protein
MNSRSAGLQDRRAFLTADILCALALIAIAGTMLTVLTARCMHASAQLSTDRQATEAAETALSHLQAGLSVPNTDSRVRIDIKPCPGGAVIAGHQWVQVIATVDGQSREVSGLVPAKMPDALPPGGKP